MNKNTFRDVRGRLVCGLVLLLSVWSFVLFPTIASAQALNWQIQGQAATGGAGTSSLAGIQGDSLYVDNNMGAAILKLKAGQVSDNGLYDLPWGTKAVYAKYEPQTATGVIFVARTIRRANGDGVLEVAQWKPSYFDVYKPDFQIGNGAACAGINPFAQFVPSGGVLAARGAFEHINSVAFETAVGMVMQHVHANQGWIAIANTKVRRHKHTSHGLFENKVTVTETAHTKPNWLVATPSGMGTGGDMGFIAPVPGPGTTLNSVKNCQADDARSLGVAAPTKTGAAGIKLIAGTNFVAQSAYNDLPQNSTQTFYHKKTKKGLGILAVIVVATIVSIATAGYGGITMVGLYATGVSGVGGGAGLWKAVFGLPHVHGGASGNSFNSVVGQLANLTSSRVPYGALGSASSSGSGSQVTGVNLDQLKAQAYSGANASGYADQGHAANPVSSTGQWDPYPNVAEHVDTGMGGTGGGFHAMSSEVKPQVQAVQSKVALSTMRKQVGGLLNFDTSPFGAMSPF